MAEAEHTRPSKGKVKITAEMKSSLDEAARIANELLFMLSDDKFLSASRTDLRVAGACRTIGTLFGLEKVNPRSQFQAISMLANWENQRPGAPPSNTTIVHSTDPKEKGNGKVKDKEKDKNKNGKEKKTPPSKRIHLMGGADQTIKAVEDENERARITSLLEPFTVRAEELKAELRADPAKVIAKIKPWKAVAGKQPVQQSNEVDVAYEGELAKGTMALKNFQSQEILAIFDNSAFHALIETMKKEVTSHPELIGEHHGKGDNSNKKYSKLKLKVGQNAQEIAKAIHHAPLEEDGSGPWSSLN